MRTLPTGSLFTDIYGLKFCVQFLHWDLAWSPHKKDGFLYKFKAGKSSC